MKQKNKNLFLRPNTVSIVAGSDLEAGDIVTIGADGRAYPTPNSHIFDRSRAVYSPLDPFKAVNAQTEK